VNALVLLLAFAGAEPVPSGPDLIVSAPSVTTLRLEIQIGELPAEKVLSQFLTHWVEFFDSDGNGQLSATEVDRVPVLINQVGQKIRMDAKLADTDGNGQANRMEVANYYRARKFTCFQLVPPTNDMEAIQLGKGLWQSLDLDQDGRLTYHELSSAPLLLNRWDLNEDERLTQGELAVVKLSDPVPDPPIHWSLEPSKDQEVVSIRIPLDSLAKPMATASPAEGKGRSRLDGQRIRFHDAEGVVAIRLQESSAQRIESARQYLLGEMNTARGNKAALHAADISADPALEWLASPFSAVDRNQDQQLDESEFQTLVNLLAEGAAAQVSLTVTHRGRNLFDHIDVNADRQLDRRELVAARLRFFDADGNRLGQTGDVTSDAIPLSLVVTVARGPIGGRFGRLRIAKRIVETELAAAVPKKLPRWFTAMDRNRDDELSPAEFAGTVVQFKNLDLNHDGLVSEDEIPAE
jgi:Ca2+-binding EF-hand superfamily protein